MQEIFIVISNETLAGEKNPFRRVNKRHKYVCLYIFAQIVNFIYYKSYIDLIVVLI